MSDLYVIAYDDAATAEQARDTLVKLQKEQLVSLADVVVVENVDGRIKLRQAVNTTGTGAAGGALWGGLIGLLFFMPFIGMAVGAGTGALAGKMTDVGIDDNMMKELGEQLQPGKAAVFALVDSMTEDKVLPEMTKYDGKLVKSSLSAEAEQHLREAAQAAKAAQS
ncbi:DUF1269 domain-containing protein [Salininema proteolyticum]|uniref:DUF1269 domain-containing protein n=1 Tax=Salininema proteolyticum TaxID=1607685 RepID=A0ABV8TYI6_9ACTN